MQEKEQAAGSRPYGAYIDFHDRLDALCAELADVANPDLGNSPFAALGLAAHVAGRVTAAIGPIVVAARLAGASWERIGEELGISKQTAFNRYAALDPNRWDGTSPRCEAAGRLAGDTEPCEGNQEAVRLFNQQDIPPLDQMETGGTLACVRHGAKLYATFLWARVYPVGGPAGPNDGCALEVYHRAQSLKSGANR